MVLFFPLLFFIALTNDDKDSKYLVYLLFLTPLGPASSLIGQLTTHFDKNNANLSIMHVEFINTSFAWFALLANIFLWMFIYLYLDQVMPNTYGIRKHPCFCLRGKRESRKNNTSTAQNDVE